MTVNDLETLYDYAYWANQGNCSWILHAPPQLTPDGIHENPCGKLRDPYGITLVHVLQRRMGMA
jgi:hypothetical protein